jgi:hypothetical protein
MAKKKIGDTPSRMNEAISTSRSENEPPPLFFGRGGGSGGGGRVALNPAGTPARGEATDVPALGVTGAAMIYLHDCSKISEVRFIHS